MAVKLLSLHQEGSLDPARVGAKVAHLAAARRRGLPVMDALVIPTETSAELLDRFGPETGARGVHAGRLAVMESTSPDLDALPNSVATLGGDLVVRSSSPLEERPEYSGAFTSYVGVAPSEVPTAVRGVWASALTAEVREVAAGGGVPSAGRPRMAVLIQRQIHPNFSGTAKVGADGVVTVISVAGPPTPLLAGWTSGTKVRVGRRGNVEGAAPSGLGDTNLAAEVAALAYAVNDSLGDDLIEWGASGARLVLLQAKRAAESRPSLARSASLARAPVAAAGVARAVHRFAGQLGETLVLPVILPGISDVGPPPEPMWPATRPTQRGAANAWATALRMASALRASVWSGPGDDGAEAAAVLGRLRAGAIAEAAGGLVQLPPAAVAHVQGLLDSLGIVAAWLVRTGALSDVDHFWALPPSAVAGRIAGDDAPNASVSREARRRALLRWEPVIFTAVRDTGAALTGEPAAAGTGAGAALVCRGLPVGVTSIARMVLIVPQPIPQLAPLLWGASAVVTTGGSSGAHLIEVARSRGVPVVLGCDQSRLFSALDAGRGGLRNRLVAVDGDTGEVVVDVGQGQQPPWS